LQFPKELWSFLFWQEIKDSLPAPDIRPLEERLSYLKKNIFKSLPNSRLTSKTDSPAYSRAATHVLAFKVVSETEECCPISYIIWEAFVFPPEQHTMGMYFIYSTIRWPSFPVVDFKEK
jgi:hypothetical protein